MELRIRNSWRRVGKQFKYKKNMPRTKNKQINRKGRGVLRALGCLGLFCLMAVLLAVIILGPSGMDFGWDLGKRNRKISEQDELMPKEELLKYFIEETTVYPGLNKPIKTIRWDKPVVTVSVEDVPPSGVVETLDGIIEKFNRNSSRIKLQSVARSGDIKIYIRGSIEGAAGKAGPSTGADPIIDSATITLSEGATFLQQTMESVLAHEIFHCLGFVGHYQGPVCRLMSAKTCGSRITINEEHLIQMLYSSGLPIGSDETQIRSFFKN